MLNSSLESVQHQWQSWGQNQSPCGYHPDDATTLLKVSTVLRITSSPLQAMQDLPGATPLISLRSFLFCFLCCGQPGLGSQDKI